ncbi:MAG TPA: hypothetical protein PLQ88_31105, partial [Blastocatellia bacterium]|nr:hypothetical protein [Blastocatellia bacterium]
MSLLQYTPTFSPEEVAHAVSQAYGLAVNVSPLPSERDQNFLLTTETGERFVFKIANATEDRALLEAQQQAMQHVAGQVSICPRVVASLDGNVLVELESPAG